MNAIRSVTESRRPGQAHQVVTPQAFAAVEAIVIENRLVTTNETAAHLDISRGLAHHIVHDKKMKVFILFTFIYIYIQYTVLQNITSHFFMSLSRTNSSTTYSIRITFSLYIIYH